MKGLALCQAFFETHGMPMIDNQFFSSRNDIAAGLVGEGSECLGFDDPVSRDHDWGPGFCLWLEDAVFDEIGKALQEAYQKLPRVFMGFGRTPARLSQQKVGVFRMGDFYQRFTGLPQIPETPGQWLTLSDEYLCACTSGAVFYDPKGSFTRIREALLSFYPEEIRLLKIASKCVRLAQSGQYNFMRSVRHGEPFAAMYAQNAFCSDVIGLVFLLKKRFAPFYKWKHRAVKDLGNLGRTVHAGVQKLIESSNHPEEKNEVIEHLCAILITELADQDISHAASDFLLDHGIWIQKRIKDETLRQKDIWGIS